MIQSLLGWFNWLIKKLLGMIGLGGNSALAPPPDDLPNMLAIFVRTNLGEKVHLELSPDWTVSQVKDQLAPQLNTTSQRIKLIFAGKELPNSLVVNQCDLGQNSILHAVRIVATGPGDDIPVSLPPPPSDTDASVPRPPSVALSQLPAATSSLALENTHRRPSDTSVVEAPTSSTATCSSISSPVKSGNAAAADTSVAAAAPAAPCGLSPLARGDEAEAPLQQCPPQRLLCDPSTVMTIQLTEHEQEQIKQLKEVSSSGARAHFYVYCVQPCAGVSTGKLRVRCARCKQGAITLDRDPNCWEDVLNKNTISCHCATPECGGESEENSAEFYFKCGGHVTSGEEDIAVALYMIRANLPGVLCLSCGEVVTPVIVFECEASHVMCLDCFITYCLSKLSERQFTHDLEYGYTLPCPINCVDSLIREVHHFRLMGDDQYVRYQHWATEEAVLAAGGVLCPKPDCGHGLIPDDDCVRIECVGGCGYVFCRHCLLDYHSGDCWQLSDVAASHQSTSSTVSQTFSVSTNGRSESGARWDVASAAAIHSLTKPCPKCRTPTERSGGCMHMVCTRASCRYNWCWVCHTEWSRDCMASHWFG